jgi:DNA-binding response OmpR family regulator
LSANNRKRILAVDDDATSLGALGQILRQGGYDVLTARNGEEALPILESEHVDLVLLDVAMPGMSGYDVCRRIRASETTRNVPVVFLTAKGRLMDIAEGEDAGSDLYLVKPVLSAKLLHLLGLFLTSDAPLSKRPRPYPTAG